MSLFLFIFKPNKINFRENKDIKLLYMVPENTPEMELTKNFSLTQSTADPHPNSNPLFLCHTGHT